MSIEFPSAHGQDGPTSDGGPLSPLDITPEDCTLANLAATVSESAIAKDCVRRLEQRITTKDGKPALGCIACNAKITLDGGYANEPGGVGLCAAPFSERAREIVAPKTYARGKKLDEILRNARNKLG